MKVSIYCMVFNHAKYLRDALEGFVSQKTDFDYEVWVHDDASSDGSQKIIIEYAEKYPHIIKPILQEENQYSKGVPIFLTYIYPKMTGDYIASCEGDDYWNDERKLQKQVDFLDSNPDYTACVHNTKVINMIDGSQFKMFDCNAEKDISFEEVIAAKSYHTSSLMYRKEYGGMRPEFFIKAKTFGDVPKAILLSYYGKIHFFPEIMSVYRHGVEGSWSSRHEFDLNARATSYTNYANMLESVNEFSEGKYDALLMKYIKRYRLNADSFIKPSYLMWSKQNREAFGGLSLRDKMVILFRVYCRPLYSFRMRRRKRRI